jgi:signal transduction histidine kinase
LARLRTNDPAPPQPINLARLLDQETRNRITHKIIHRHHTPDTWVHGSRIQLIRVIDNLLDNAQRHAATTITTTLHPTPTHAVLTVTDDGTGIPPKDRERVFERFTRLPEGQTKDPHGSGLGLAISRDIAHAHHGTLTIQDSPHGARFVLELPLLGTGETTAEQEHGGAGG